MCNPKTWTQTRVRSSINCQAYALTSHTSFNIKKCFFPDRLSLSLSLSIYIYIYIYIDVYAYKYLYIYICIDIYIYMYRFRYMSRYIYIVANVCVCPSRWQNFDAFGFCYCPLLNFLLGVGVIYIYFNLCILYGSNIPSLSISFKTAGFTLLLPKNCSILSLSNIQQLPATGLIQILPSSEGKIAASPTGPYL